MERTSQTLAAYEAFLATLQRNPDLFRNKDLEMDLYGVLNPSGILDRLYFEEQRWLGFEDFLQYYLSLHGDTVRQRFGFNSAEEFVPGLRARLYRTQFGFLTEYHAYLLASVFFGSDNVYRSVALDKAGVDFQVRLHGNTYNMHVFVDNPRAWGYRKFKSENKQVDNSPGIHVNLPYSLSQNRFNSVRYLPKGFGIYQPGYLRYFVQEVEQGRILNNNITGTTDAGFVYGPQAQAAPDCR